MHNRSRYMSSLGVESQCLLIKDLGHYDSFAPESTLRCSRKITPAGQVEWPGIENLE